MNLVAFHASRVKCCRPSTFAVAASFRRARASILYYWASPVPFTGRHGYLSSRMQPTISRPRLVELLDAARGKRVAVVGDAMLDVYLRGDVDRISPEAPVPVVRVRERRYALGGAGNVAQNVRAVGARCDLVAAIGDDAGGRQLSSMLDAIDAGLR